MPLTPQEAIDAVIENEVYEAIYEIYDGAGEPSKEQATELLTQFRDDIDRFLKQMNEPEEQGASQQQT